jgi:nicotinate-nucleotide--dimethylbenzimidazole phosphoribosyltransferase
MNVDLAQVALAVRWPPSEPADAAREALAAAGIGPAHGRLAELAVWWAGVRGDRAAPPPGRVAAVGVTTPLPDPARLDVRRLPLDPPPEPDAALAWGVSLADALADEGVDLLLVAVDDVPGRRVLGAELVGADAVSALGWPQADDGSADASLAGLVDDERWMHEVVQVRDGLRAVRGLAGEPAALLRGLASPALAAATGLLLRSAARRTPAVLGGPGAAAAALLARGQAWECSDWWQLAPVGDEALTERVVAGLRLTPLDGLAVPLEDGTAALLAAEVLAAATALLGVEAEAQPEAEPAPEPEPGG